MQIIGAIPTICDPYQFNSLTGSITSAIASLYALMNGDSVYFIFDDLIKNHYFLGTIYCYSFILFSLFL